MTQLTTDLRRGTELAGYRVDALLGRGGMGVVYLAEQLRLKRRVALKLLAPELAQDARFRERFLRESELAASLDHPNVVPIFDAGEADGLLYIAMRYVEGTDLGSLLASDGRLEPERAVAIIGSVASALDAAHARGLVHRDVKPANALLAADGHVYLADFGLTRSAQEGSPEEKPHLSGTLEYVAPEQIEGHPPDPSADIYALGCVLYHTLAGQPPYAKRTQMELLWAHFNEDPPSLHAQRPELPEAIDPVVAKALAKEPDQRYPSGRELAASAAEALGVGLTPSRISRKKLLLLAAGGALTVAAATGVPAILLTRGGGADISRPTTLITRASLQRIDPATNTLTATIAIGAEDEQRHSSAGPTVAAGERAVWVSHRPDQTIVRIDPTRNVVTQVISARGSHASIATGFGSVWLVNDVGLTEIELRPGGETRPIRLDHGVWDIVVGHDAVWAMGGSLRRGWISRVDPQSNRMAAAIDLTSLGGIGWPSAAGEGSVWTQWSQPEETDDRGVARIDPSTNKLAAAIPTPFSPLGMAAGDGGVWLSNNSEDCVWRIDPATNRLTSKIQVGDGPIGVAVGVGSVWVANALDGTISRIDPGMDNVRATIEVGGRPDDIAVGEGGVWVTVEPA